MSNGQPKKGAIATSAGIADLDDAGSLLAQHIHQLRRSLWKRIMRWASPGPRSVDRPPARTPMPRAMPLWEALSIGLGCDALRPDAPWRTNRDRFV